MSESQLLAARAVKLALAQNIRIQQAITKVYGDIANGEGPVEPPKPPTEPLGEVEPNDEA